MIVDGNEEGGDDFAEFEQKVAGGDTQQADDTKADEGDEEDADEGDKDDDSSDAGEEGADEGEEDDSSEDGEKNKRPKKSAAERIRELNTRNRENERTWAAERRALLSAIEAKNPLTEEEDSGTEGNEREAPDPKDLKKYPLGHLDDRYIQDAIDYKAAKAAKEMVDSLLQRQEQSAEQEAAEALLSDLRSKADNVVTKGTELHDDFESVVYEAGLKGEYDLTQITFEAAAEAENGAQILYDLATDPKEATRVAQLSPLGQLKYVAEQDAKLSKGSAKARIPGAQPPPAQSPRGGQGRKTISPATQNFAEFEQLAKSANKR